MDDEQTPKDDDDDKNNLKDEKEEDKDKKSLKRLQKDAPSQDDESDESKSNRKKDQQHDPELKRETNSDDYVPTSGVDQRAESFFASDTSKFKSEPLETTTTRDEVEKDLAKFKEMCQTDSSASSGSIEHECMKLWLEYESITSQLSKELCEQLRLILEPTVCSKLKGIQT